MNKDRDYYNKILGLRPGATQAEIKMAYRNLVKLYHPDRDQSPDAQVMYREIRAAYEALFDPDIRSGTEAEPVNNRNYSRRTTKSSRHSTQNARQSTTDRYNPSEDQEFWKNWEKEQNVKVIKIPFRLENLSQVFIRSLAEMSIIELMGAVVAMIIAIISCSIVHPYEEMVISFYIISGVIYVFFKYYFTPSAWPFIIKLIMGILYAAVLYFLIDRFCMLSKERLNLLFVFTIISGLALTTDLSFDRRRN
jgi:hypothetical protein